MSLIATKSANTKFGHLYVLLALARWHGDAGLMITLHKEKEDDPEKENWHFGLRVGVFVGYFSFDFRWYPKLFDVDGQAWWRAYL